MQRLVRFVTGRCDRHVAIWWMAIAIDVVSFRLSTILHARVFVHHVLQSAVIDDHRDGCNGDISHGTKLSTVIQMFVLQTKVVPDESTKDLDQTKDESNDVGIFGGSRAKLHKDVDDPDVSKENIFDDGQVIVELRWIDNLIPKEFILSRVLVEEAPIHLQIPKKFVRRSDERSNDPNVQERVRCRFIEVMNSRRSTHGVRADHEESTGVFPGIGQMRKLVSCVTIPAKTLGKTKPRR